MCPCPQLRCPDCPNDTKVDLQLIGYTYHLLQRQFHIAAESKTTSMSHCPLEHVLHFPPKNLTKDWQIYCICCWSVAKAACHKMIAESKTADLGTSLNTLPNKSSTSHKRAKQDGLPVPLKTGLQSNVASHLHADVEVATRFCKTMKVFSLKEKSKAFSTWGDWNIIWGFAGIAGWPTIISYIMTIIINSSKIRRIEMISRKEQMHFEHKLIFIWMPNWHKKINFT